MKRPKAINMAVRILLHVKIEDDDHCHPRCLHYSASADYCKAFKKILRVKQERNGLSIKRTKECRESDQFITDEEPADGKE